MKNVLRLLPAIIMIAAASCKKNDLTMSAPASTTSLEEMMRENGNNPDDLDLLSSSSGLTEQPVKAGNKYFLYTESNSAGTNEILSYRVLPNGKLKAEETTVSGGAGTGAPLGSQGALVMDQENSLLFAVNAGSNSVSSFNIDKLGHLSLAHTVWSGGEVPVSVAYHNHLLYILNRGSDAIAGFSVTSAGHMTPISGSMQSLSSTGVDAPQISFAPGGGWLLVTEKATNVIGTFQIGASGAATAGTFTPSVGATPFGFDFARGYMIVSNAVGGMPLAGSATSYAVASGTPMDINGAIANNETAPCWVATTRHGRYAFITNTATNNISSYYIAADGSLHLISGEAAKSDMGPLDIVVLGDNRHVYALNAGSHSITGYDRQEMGGLDMLGSWIGLPPGATGLAMF